MNARRLLLPIMSLFVAANLGAAGDIALPEQFLPRLETLLQQASRQSPRMISRSLDLEIAENGRVEARASLLPSVGGSASFYQSREDRGDGAGFASVDKLYYNFSLNQPIYHWGERRNTSRIGEIQLQIAQGNHREAYRTLAQEIRISYLQLIAKKAYLERVRLNDRYQRGLLQQAEDRLAKNAASESEVFSVRVNADRAQLEAERYLVDYENAKQSLARLTGAVRIEDSDISGTIPEIVYPAEVINRQLAAFLSQKEPANNEVVNAARQVEIMNLSYLNQKTRLKPKFNFTLGTSQDDQSYTRDIGQRYQLNSYFAGVTANWTIFDGFASGAATRSALARRRQAEHLHREAAEAAGRQAQSQAKQLEFSARSLELATRMLGSAKGALAAREADFSRGVVSEADVSQSRLNHYDARWTSDIARIEYLAAATAFLGLVSSDPVLANLETK